MARKAPGDEAHAFYFNVLKLTAFPLVSLAFSTDVLSASSLVKDELVFLKYKKAYAGLVALDCNHSYL